MDSHRIWLAGMTLVAAAGSWAQTTSPAGAADADAQVRQTPSAVERWKSSRNKVQPGISLHDRLYGAASASMAESAGRQGSSTSDARSAGVYGNAGRAMLPSRPGDTPLIDSRSGGPNRSTSKRSQS